MRLTATPRTTLLDATVHIRLTGAKPGERVTISASERSWRSHAVFRADSSGTVDLARDRALSGTYTGRNTMGLFWSLSKAEGAGGKPPEDGGSVRLRAVEDGREIA
ncbi:MAG TPA: acyl-CoA thioesterase/BAAT N-terminal domain-containing protein, partial [Gaiellaceae bacterium]|nr:acyl-CoA thioesterase/BAAT N-terminal domain-containing protein [Gaiellaceae bacterium]